MNDEQNSKNISQKIGFIGGGNMAKAICEGIVTNGLVTFDQIYVSGPRLKNLGWWIEQGCNTYQENEKVVSKADIIFICVKPHILETVTSELKSTFSRNKEVLPSKLYVSVLAGISLETLNKELESLHGRIIRIMPNTSMVVGEGCTLLSPSSSATDADKELVCGIVSATGLCKEVPEDYINHLGALTASGSAFIYMILEALADGAVKMGIPRALATELAAQTILGAGKMARDAGKHTAQLKDEICSPAGTTIQGVHALEKHGIRAAFIEAVEATAKRAVEIEIANKKFN
ncbi:pyrroline-5-carboxylate reductase 3 [Diorhabda sublineata]|uniref:pyrroline-5-carboxylate reductase 3 n=1 Tax=Diorhabda sublineata TaxID=1163346 RepID=UPI0024E063BF|nr:pyrroline-5-carboxylate reductase 3 [Diorhabda sublineata]